MPGFASDFAATSRIQDARYMIQDARLKERFFAWLRMTAYKVRFRVAARNDLASSQPSLMLRLGKKDYAAASRIQDARYMIQDARLKERFFAWLRMTAYKVRFRVGPGIRSVPLHDPIVTIKGIIIFPYMLEFMQFLRGGE